VRARVWVQAVGAAGLLVGTGLGPPAVAQQAYTTTGTVAPSALPLELKVRRVRDGVEVVIENTGSAPQLEQTSQGTSWLGRLTTSQAAVLPRGPQAVALPEAGVRSLSIEGNGAVFTLRATPVGGTPMRPPLVSADGLNLILSFAAPLQASLQTTQRNSLAPGVVANPNFVPPLRARATAPPVGDMAVGTMLIANPSYVNISGPPVTMTVKNAQAKNVLMALSQLGGYGFVYVDEPQGAPNLPRPISIAFRNESYGRAVNSALMAAGIQGKKDGNTLFAGPKVLSKSFGAQLSKVFRLNQVSSNSAADYLANLGATVTKTNVITTAVTQGVAQNSAVQGGPNSATTTGSTQTSVEAYGSSIGPLVGLQATSDSRLSTITLVGSPSLVAVAERYLKQLDLRQRQVALSVRILDVTLDNDKQINNSFAFRYGNNFIVNNNGQLLAAFGSLLPPTQEGFDILSGGSSNAKPVRETVTTTCTDRGCSSTTSGKLLFPESPAPINPGSAYIRDKFYDFVKAQIESRSTKVLASPTLILSENPEEIREGTDDVAANIQTLGTGSGGSAGGGGSANATIGRTKANESYVTVGEQVIINFEPTAGQNGAPTTCKPVFGIAGLTFGARVSKIDDNGFVTFSMSPAIQASVDERQVPNCGPINILAVRRLDTGSARVRDGQTLILTGVISESDGEIVRKWPILGDIPLVGQFFRATSGNRGKRELVILVTPRIINDTEGGSYGYGFEPSSRDSRQLMNSSPSSTMPGFTTQP
jgi:type IV pilus assembly protein PilQ